jgi:AraC-like DNA-binding protein
LERAVWVEGTAGLMVGVGLMPQGWPRLTGLPADEFTNRMRPLSDCLGPAADTLFERLKAAAPDGDAALYAVLDEVLGGLMSEAPEADLVARAHAALQDPAVQTVGDWADIVGLSSRQLERFSLRSFGLSPKRLLRRQRVLRTLAAMRESQGTWSQSIDHQFTDQAHFIHEFNYYMGVSPGAYLARHQPIMADAWKNRKELLGSPVQVLQPPAKTGA